MVSAVASLRVRLLLLVTFALVLLLALVFYNTADAAGPAAHALARSVAVLCLFALGAFGAAWILSELLLLRRVRAELESRVEQLTAQLAAANEKLLSEARDRARVEQELRESAERLELVMRGTNDGIWDWDMRTGHVYFSPRWKGMLGYEDDEIAGRFEEWEKRLHPDDRERALKAVADYIAGKIPAHELEHRLLHKDGTYRWILARGFALRDGSGKPYRMVGSHLDLTEWRRAQRELERTAAELRRSNEELEQFAYVASHDLQEPLRMVASYTQLLQRRYAAQLDAAANEFIDFAVDGAKRMQGFIQDLLHYSRVGAGRPEPQRVELDEILATALHNLSVMIRETGADILADPLPCVRGDARQLAQLFQNLLGNAMKFQRPGETPRIRVTAAREEEAGGLWRIGIADNGIGIEPRFFERVFVIFQRLHSRDEYAGSGLGLAICKKIVERHGGRIWVDSQKGRGSVFFFTLPADCDDEIPPR